MSEEDDENILPESKRGDWSVKTYKGGINKKTGQNNPLIHKLLYKGREIDSQKGFDGQRAMLAQAAFANEKGLVPNETACLADPQPYRTKAKENAEIAAKERDVNLRKTILKRRAH